MAKVICLTEKRRKTSEAQQAEARTAALKVFAHAVLAHLVTRFYDKGIFEIPVQSSVRLMMRRMTDDPSYSAADLIEMSTNLDMLDRVEKTLLRTLVERGILPKDFA